MVFSSISVPRLLLNAQSAVLSACLHKGRCAHVNLTFACTPWTLCTLCWIYALFLRCIT